MNQRLTDLVQAVEWPEPAFAGMFLQDVDHMWGTEAGREEVLKWIGVLGKPSQFVEGRLWTTDQLREHFTAWDAWVAADEAKKVEDKPAPVPDRHLATPDARELSRRWHVAVEQRRTALATSRLLMQQTILAERARHKDLEVQWDQYVMAVKDGRVDVQQSTS